MSIFHLHAATGNRASSQSARACFEYISRTSRYARRGDRLRFLTSANMPSWVSTALDYWMSADLYERANGRLYKTLEFALPRELSPNLQIALAEQFVSSLFSQHELLPYTLAIHDGGGKNPHAHVMVSERVLDGYERSPKNWFKRAASLGKSPEIGGAKKTARLKPAEWLGAARETWALMVNAAMQKFGHPERIDHRSNAARGIKKPPTRHIGPVAISVERSAPATARRVKELQEELDVEKELRAVQIELEKLRIQDKLAQQMRNMQAGFTKYDVQPHLSFPKQKGSNNDFIPSH